MIPHLILFAAVSARAALDSGASGPSDTAAATGSATGIASNSIEPGSPQYALQIALAAKNVPRAACQHSSCDTCASDPECGWCEVRGICLAGDSLGPSPGVVAEPCTLWSYGGCIGTDCRNLQTCSDCMSNSDCGWCESDCMCTDKHTSDPTTPAYGECTKGWYVADGWTKKMCPLHIDSTCLTVHKIHTASAEAAQEKAQQEAAEAEQAQMKEAELKDIHALNPTTFPLNLRVIGKLSIVGVEQSTVVDDTAKQAVREALAATFEVEVAAVALPMTKALAPLMEAPKPALLQLHEQSQGFFGGLFSKIKNIFNLKKKKPPPQPPAPPPVAEMKFKIGCTTEDEQSNVLKAAQALAVGGTKELQALIIKNGLDGIKDASNLAVLNIKKGEEEVKDDTLPELVEEEGKEKKKEEDKSLLRSQK